ncbi:MAG: polysulfide reductase NrfD [Myxococcales bacterium]|nr:polysulfide reductase NrfD [Myxococcales bacterium]
MNEIVRVHHNPLSALGQPVWHWEIPVYLFLGGLAAGVMIVSALLARRFADGGADASETSQRSPWGRLMILAAPAALWLGMFALLLDLDLKRHVLRFYTTFQLSSPMSWGAWILLAIYPATLLFGLSQTTESERDWLAAKLRIGALRRILEGLHSWAQQRQRTLTWANIALGVALGAYTGVLLGALGARALWSSSLLGPLFLVSGFSTGAALTMLLPLTHREHALLRNWDMIAIGVELALLALLFVGLVSGAQAGQRAAALFLGGRFTAIFWALVVVAGLVVPLALESIEVLRRRRAALVAPVLLLVGGLALRWILVVAGQSPLG